MHRSTFLKGLAIFSAALAFTACDTDSPVESGSTTMNRPAPPPPPANANPAFVMIGTVPTGKHTSPLTVIQVVDADGSDKATVFRGQSGSIFRKPTWGPGGAGTAASPWTISFTEGIGDVSYLRRVDVWVVNGVVQSSAATTVVSYPSTAGKAARIQAWSPSTTTREIAYTEADWNSLPSPETSRLMVVSDTGGTPVELHAASGVHIGPISWNADGSKLAVTCSSATQGVHIRIIDRVTPANVQVILANQHNSISFIDWSRSGLNQIAYGANASVNGTYYLYTTNVSDATPTPSQVLSSSQAVIGTYPTWSPDNTRLAYNGDKIITLATGTLSTILTGLRSPDWRR